MAGLGNRIKEIGEELGLLSMFGPQGEFGAEGVSYTNDGQMVGNVPMLPEQAQPIEAPLQPSEPAPAPIMASDVALGNPVPESMEAPLYNRPASEEYVRNVPTENEQAFQLANYYSQQGINSPKELGVAATKDPSILNSIKGFLGDEEKMLRLAMAFNTLRMRPDTGLQQFASKRIETIAANRQTNRTADMLLERGLVTPTQAELLRSGQIKASDLFGGTDKFSRILEMMKTPEGMKQLGQLKELGALGSGTNITIGDKGETKLQEEIGKGLGTKITEDFNAGTQARSALDSVELLMGLSENLESATSIPPALRNLVPEGVSDPIDAYRGVMTNVAKSLRIKGEGTMSDRDIDLLIRQAGPVTSNPQARRVMQEALKRKAEINLQLSKAASDFMLERINKQQYLDRVSEINNIPLMDENMRSYISSLGGGAAKPAGGQVKVISVE